jgi:CBS domain-containing protein
VVDVMTRDPLTVTATETIGEADDLMSQNKIRQLPVVKGKELIGIVTDRDIVVEVLANGRDPANATVAEIMSTRLVVAAGNEDIAIAVDRMKLHGVRRLPVVDHAGKLMGILTLDDVLKLHAARAAALADIVSKEQGREYRARR